MIRVEIFNRTEAAVTDATVALIEEAADRTARKTPFQETLTRLDLSAVCQLTLVDGETIRETNREFREVDRVTDILSFPSLAMTEGRYDGEFSAETLVNPFAEEREVFLGDLMLCMDKAREQAEAFGQTVDQEVAFLISHGMLHLLGYDHMETEEDKRMRAIQAEVRAEMGF